MFRPSQGVWNAEVPRNRNFLAASSQCSSRRARRRRQGVGHVPTAGLAALSGHSHGDTGGLTNERLPVLSGSRRTTLSKHAGQWRPEPGRRKDDEASGWGSGARRGRRRVPERLFPGSVSRGHLLNGLAACVPRGALHVTDPPRIRDSGQRPAAALTTGRSSA